MSIYTQFRKIQQIFLLSFLLLMTITRLQAQFCLGLETRLESSDNSELLLNLTTENFTGVTSMQFTITYDPVDYELIELVENNLDPNDIAPYGDRGDGNLTIAWFDRNAVGVNYESEKPLMTFKFKRLTENLSSFKFTEDPTVIEVVIVGEDFNDLKILNNVLDCQTGEKLIQSIDGQFAYDINDDCMVDAEEIVDAANHNWRGWNVSATQGGQFYLSGYPFSDGSFNLKLFEGDNEVRIIPPSLYHEVCEPVLTINPADLTEENFLEPLIKVKEECAFLEVNLTSFPEAPCNESFYIVECANNGTAIAKDAYLELNLDHRITVDEIDKPAEDLGDNKFIIQLGDINIGDGTFVFIKVVLPCDLTAEEMLRNEVRIYPNEICGAINQDWSGASLKVSGKCQEGKVIFEVENVGKGDMTTPLEYVVIEDAIIFKTQAVQLASGMKEIVELEANGSSYYIQIPQENGHPGNSRRPSTFVEACGRDEVGNFSTGFANRFPQDDNDFFVDVDFHLLNSFINPGVLMTNPIGYTAEHLVNPDDFIEYQIFFNKKSNTTELTIVDNLSNWLDPTSFEPVLSNQPYEYTIQNNVITFTVPHNTSSFGFDRYSFIKFKIKPKANIPSGTQIFNNATIYESEQDPIETNLVFHTVKKDFLQTSTNIEKSLINVPKLSVYPNPSTDVIQFELQEAKIADYELTIYNAYGQLVKTTAFNNSTFQFRKGDLPAGTYFYQVNEAEQSLTNGFFVLIE